MDAVGTLFFIEMNNHFRIGVGIKAVAAGFELWTQFRKVLNFAVEYDPNTAVFVMDRLVACG